MKEVEYQAVLPKLAASIPLDVIAQQTGIPLSTLYSISSGYHQTRIRRLVPSMRRTEKIQELIQSYLSGQHLADLALAVSYSPCLLARSILEVHYGMNKTDISSILRDPSMIKDDRLRNEMEECITRDIYYSPQADRIRLSVGLEFEQLLCSRLHTLNIHYEDEDELKRQGHAKTPDVRLCVPIAVRGHIVNWIDSKAMFGDRTTHQNHQQQLQAYCNRYGSGLVIYWFSYIDELQSSSSSSSILLMDHFPAQHEIITLTSYTSHPKQNIKPYIPHPLQITLPTVIQEVAEREQRGTISTTTSTTSTPSTTNVTTNKTITNNNNNTVKASDSSIDVS